jgi:tetratricopeptide (TPR) repeat protein
LPSGIGGLLKCLTDKKMSYINDALKKAQQDRDSRYERFGQIISSGPPGPDRPRKGRLPRGVASALLILIPAGLLAVYVLWPPPPAPGPAKPAALASGSERPAGEAVSSGGALAGPREERAAEPAGAVPEDAKRAEKSAPAGPVAAVPPGGKTAGPPVPEEVEVLYREALSAQRRGEMLKAEGLYERVLELDPRHVRSLNNLGVISMGLKKRDRAISLFNKAIVLRKDYVDPYYNLACLYSQANEIDEGLWFLRAAIAMNGNVKRWAKKDADLKNVVESAAFKKIMEGQKN